MSFPSDEGGGFERPKGKEPSALQLSQAIMDGLQWRAVRLLSKKQRALAIEALEHIAERKTKDGLSQAQIKAYTLYHRYYGHVLEWWKTRPLDGRIVTISLQADLFLNPKLDFLEKCLLADVAWLQRQERGCDKTVVRFAIELGISIRGVVDIIHRLKKKGYLRTYRAGSKRLLEFVNKFKFGAGDPLAPEAAEVSENVVESQLERTSEGSLNALPDQSKRKTGNCKLAPKSATEKGFANPELTSSLQGQQETTKTTSGAAPPAPASLPSLRSGGEPHGSPVTPPSSNSSSTSSTKGKTNDERLRKFSQGYKIVSGRKWTQQDEEAFIQFESETKGSWPVLGLLDLLVASWELKGKSTKNRDGTMYHFGASQGARKLSHFLKHVDQIEEDVISYFSSGGYEAPDFQAGDSGWAAHIDNICQSLEEQRREDSQVDAVEQGLGQLFKEEMKQERARDEADRAAKYWTRGGVEIPDPSSMAWSGIRRVLEGRSGGEMPAEKWLEVIMARLRQDADRVHPMMRNAYDDVKRLLHQAKVLPQDLEPRPLARDPNEGERRPPDPATARLQDLYIHLRLQNIGGRNEPIDPAWLKALLHRLIAERDTPSDATYWGRTCSLLDGQGLLPKDFDSRREV